MLSPYRLAFCLQTISLLHTRYSVNSPVYFIPSIFINRVYVPFALPFKSNRMLSVPAYIME